MSGRIVLLSTTPRVAPGLLSLAGWTTLRAADEIYAATQDHPLVGALAAVDLPVRVPGTEGAGTAAFLLGRAAQAEVVWLSGEDGDPELTTALAGGSAVVETVAGSWDVPGARVLDLVAVMDRLRSPGGCPWDAAQTHTSLLPYLLEETYETVEAIEGGDLVGLREELGDLLLQVVFHARIGQEHVDRPWSLDDVAAGIVAKLVSRHPHVFGGSDPQTGEVVTAAQVESSWEELKRVEKGRSSAVDGVPLAQPALALASKLMARAERFGVVVEPVAGEAHADPGRRVGAELMASVAAARAAGVDPEAALRSAARDYAQAVRSAELGE
jgi:XTP/dITP diphosphohydrolase